MHVTSSSPTLNNNCNPSSFDSTALPIAAINTNKKIQCKTPEPNNRNNTDASPSSLPAVPPSPPLAPPPLAVTTDETEMTSLLKLITKLSVLVVSSVVTTWLVLLVFGYILPFPGVAIEGWLNALCALYCFDFHSKKYYYCCKFCHKWMYRCCSHVAASRIKKPLTPISRDRDNDHSQDIDKKERK